MEPTIVLVHGAFAESASWDGVIDALADDYPVVAAANPLQGLASDAAAVSDLVAGIDGPVVLVGHSYGGAVISNVAGVGDIIGLIYVAAFAPLAGESCFALSDRFPGGTLGDTLELRPCPGRKDLCRMRAASVR
jgi:pimeloyl-ACP methyl ester carboxylesterase